MIATISGARASLANDEALFYDSVYEFADREVRRHVRDMDEHARLRKERKKHVSSSSIG